MITRLSHATIYVLDQDSALDFYTNKLDFEVRNDVTMEYGFRWLTIGTKKQPELEIILMPVQAGGMLDAEIAAHFKAILEKGALGAGVLETDDCNADYEKLKARGVEFIAPPQTRPYGIEALMKDNQGNWFSLTQHG